jgi:hypothetical protein
MQDVAAQVSQFVDLQLWHVLYLVFVGLWVVWLAGL